MGVITACNPGERRDRRSFRQTDYWSKLELISSGFNRRPCPKSTHGRNMMSSLGLQMHMYTHKWILHSFTDSWPWLSDNVILHLQNAKKVNPSNTGQCMVFVPRSWFNTLQFCKWGRWTDSLASFNEVNLVGYWMASEWHMASGNTRHLWELWNAQPCLPNVHRREQGQRLSYSQVANYVYDATHP